MATLWEEFCIIHEHHIIIQGFSPDHEVRIRNEIANAYNNSSIFRGMVDDWFKPVPLGEPLHGPIIIRFEDNTAYTYANSGEIYLDVAFCESLLVINNYGKAVEETLASVLIHEMVHALTGRIDNGVGARDHDPDRPLDDYRGETVIESNRIYRQLGLEEENSYISQDLKGNILIENKDYTKGEKINCSILIGSTDPDRAHWNTLNLGNSKDLLIGDGRNNELASGGGDDFLYGMDGEDHLFGGDGKDFIDGGTNRDFIFGDGNDYVSRAC